MLFQQAESELVRVSDSESSCWHACAGLLLQHTKPPQGVMTSCLHTTNFDLQRTMLLYISVLGAFAVTVATPSTATSLHLAKGPLLFFTVAVVLCMHIPTHACLPTCLLTDI